MGSLTSWRMMKLGCRGGEDESILLAMAGAVELAVPAVVRRNSRGSRRWETPLRGSPFWSLSHTTMLKVRFYRETMLKSVKLMQEFRWKLQLMSELPQLVEDKFFWCALYNRWKAWFSRSDVYSHHMGSFFLVENRILSDKSRKSYGHCIPPQVAKQSEGQISSSSSLPYMASTSPLADPLFVVLPIAPYIFTANPATNAYFHNWLKYIDISTSIVGSNTHFDVCFWKIATFSCQIFPHRPCHFSVVRTIVLNIACKE